MRIGRVGAGEAGAARWGVLEGERRCGWREVAGWMQGAEAAAAMRERLLAEAGTGAIFWECREVQAGAAEWVCLPARGLGEVPADHGPFASRFGGREGGVAVFGNLSGDAVLVVPEPVRADREGWLDYGDLTRFLRHAPAEQQRALWTAAGGAVADRLGGPLWISTAGMGVPWLHVRLDRRPKYYRCAAYRQAG